MERLEQLLHLIHLCMDLEALAGPSLLRLKQPVVPGLRMVELLGLHQPTHLLIAVVAELVAVMEAQQQQMHTELLVEQELLFFDTHFRVEFRSHYQLHQRIGSQQF
jgi:hypothetical protein